MKLSFIAIVAALVISLTGCERRSATDATITTTVKNRLAADPTTSAARINIDTSNGVVTLSGAVPTAAEKSEAERIARNTQGVTQVVNNITVEQEAGPTGGTFGDATILANIKSQLVASGIIGTNVDVKNGEVTITGEVDNAQEKSRADEIARQASGVKSVKNQLVIKRR
jgi:hyperosmotically inducible periplasmic protein